MAQNKLGEANAFYRSFGFDAMDELPDEQLYRLGRRVVRVATDQLPQLAGEGLTTALITNLNTIATNFDNALDAKEAAVKHRDIMTQERIDKANEVYKELVRLCNTGKDIWTTTDEARYNDYVIYDTPGGVPETPPAT